MIFIQIWSTVIMSMFTIAMILSIGTSDKPGKFLMQTIIFWLLFGPMYLKLMNVIMM